MYACLALLDVSGKKRAPIAIMVITVFLVTKLSLKKNLVSMTVAYRVTGVG